MSFTYLIGLFFLTALNFKKIHGVTPCFSCPSDIVGVITQWNNVISATGEDGGECIPCTICDNNAYKRKCTKCMDAVCMEPKEVTLGFYITIFGYIFFSLSVAFIYFRHFHNINHIKHT